MRTPCAQWAVLLAISPAELVPADRQALADHLAGCQGCRSVQDDYALQDAFLRQQPLPLPLEGLPPVLVGEWAAERGQGRLAAARNDPSALPARRRSRRLPVLLGTVAAVLIVALLISALVVSRVPSGTHPYPTAQGTRTPSASTPTATPAPDGTWVPVPGLTQLSNEPIIAPGDRAIIYQISSYTDHQKTQLTITRSVDGGQTWRSFPAPLVVTDLFGVGLIVSPLDAQVIILRISNYDTVPSTCPGLTAAAGVVTAYSGFPLCDLYYFSRDGGSHWQRLALPLSAQDRRLGGGLIPMGNLGSEASSVLRAQGTRLYALLYGPTGGHHLLVSEDGGQTWRVDDVGLEAANRYLCDAMPAPDGATIFALVFTQPCGAGGSEEFWRSDDAGVTWHQAGPLPGNVQSFLVSSQGARPMPLVYMLVSDPGTSVAFDVMVSSDGGVTWHASPLQGTLYITGLIGVLSDGTLLVSVVQPLPLSTYSDPYLYRWKAGETAWHQVVSAPIHGLISLLVLEHPETIWIVQFTGTYAVQQLKKT
jgi:hypothetical protein